MSQTKQTLDGLTPVGATAPAAGPPPEDSREPRVEGKEPDGSRPSALGSRLPGYRITFRAVPGEVPADKRLAMLLKRALRTYGFRCVLVEELPVG